MFVSVFTIIWIFALLANGGGAGRFYTFDSFSILTLRMRVLELARCVRMFRNFNGCVF